MTHGGKNLDDMDGEEISRFKGVLDDADGDLDPDYVSKLNFSGFNDEEEAQDNPQVKKTRQQIYEEMIKKSKLSKLTRQQEQEENA
jgi:hypothetical protein